jgi:hypothetical protein
MCAVDDCEPWVVKRETTPIARREYRCGECGRWIRIGEKYHKVVGLDAYGQSQTPVKWDTYRTCRHCIALGEWMNVVCGGWPIRGLRAELVEHWYDGYRSVPFGRLIVAQKHRWHDGRDPIPSGVSELAKAMLQKAVA